jgi:signal transduction histidine kinase
MNQGIMPSARKRWWNPSISTSVVLMGVLAVLFIAATFSAMAWQRRASLLHERQAGNDRLVDTLAEHANGIFRQSTLVLSVVAERLTHDGTAGRDDPRFTTFLAGVMHQAPLVAAIRVIDPDGRYLQSYPEHAPDGLEVADRDYVRSHLRGPSGLVIGSPLSSRVNGLRLLPLSLGLRDGNGRLRAVIAVMIHLDALDALFDSIRQKPNGTIALFRDDGTLLGRGPADKHLIGRNFAGGPLFKLHLPVATSGSYTDVVSTDGKLRQASYRHLSGLPVVVAVSNLVDDTLVEWRGYATTLGLIAVPLILATAAITWALHRQLAARESFERLLARRSRDLELANGELRHMAEISAHHLQEPLRTVLSYTQLLVRNMGNGDTAVMEEYLGFIRSGVERMKSQLTALQRYLGVEHCRPHQPVALTRILAEVIDLQMPRLVAAGTEIRAQELPEIMGDRQHLSGLFHHLLSAVLERCRPDSRQIVAVEAGRDGIMWHVTVSADNTDIDFGESETEFPLLAPGSQPEGAATQAVSLALCRRIVQIHGGRMWAETTDDGMARLHVLLPAE